MIMSPPGAAVNLSKTTNGVTQAWTVAVLQYAVMS